MIGNLHRIGVRIDLETADGVTPDDVIDVFHRWIRTRALPGPLVDVADYSHVPDGPGILLIGHQGNWAADVVSTTPGLTYVRKASLAGPLQQRIATVIREALRAAALIEEDERIAGRLRHRTDRLSLFANDRLRAAPEPLVFDGFRNGVEAAIRDLYPDRPPEIEPISRSKGRLGMVLRGSFGPNPGETLARLGH